MGSLTRWCDKGDSSSEERVAFVHCCVARERVGESLYSVPRCLRLDHCDGLVCSMLLICTCRGRHQSLVESNYSQLRDSDEIDCASISSAPSALLLPLATLTSHAHDFLCVQCTTSIMTSIAHDTDSYLSSDPAGRADHSTHRPDRTAVQATHGPRTLSSQSPRAANRSAASTSR